MDVDNHLDIRDEIGGGDPSSRRYLSVMVPHRCEGISYALRAAFDPSDDAAPSEFDRLLQQLN